MVRTVMVVVRRLCFVYAGTPFDTNVFMEGCMLLAVLC